jgi:hypothetical protein
MLRKQGCQPIKLQALEKRNGAPIPLRHRGATGDAFEPEVQLSMWQPEFMVNTSSQPRRQTIVMDPPAITDAGLWGCKTK